MPEDAMKTIEESLPQSYEDVGNACMHTNGQTTCGCCCYDDMSGMGATSHTNCIENCLGELILQIWSNVHSSGGFRGRYAIAVLLIRYAIKMPLKYICLYVHSSPSFCLGQGSHFMICLVAKYATL